MTTVPSQPRIYHITHVDNLPSILADGGLWSDAELIARGGPAASIGMGNIKQRRLGLSMKCHPGDWHLVRRIGVQAPAVQQRVLQALAGASHRSAVKVCREWYF